MISKKTSALLLVVLTLAVAGAALLVPAVPQPLDYHRFADQRGLWGIPNFGDVVSNLPFAVVGLLGLVFLFGRDAATAFLDRRERWPYFLVFAGLLLTSIGSSYYHLQPSNGRLVWDRLPMTIVFMSMVAAVIAERISLRAGLWLLPILVLIGMGSVGQWYLSEVRGHGDLRLYAAVQLYAALVLLVALLFPPLYTRGVDLGWVLGFYVLAKVFETFDRPIFDTCHVVSGHTLKHLAAAAGGYCILRMLRRRQAIQPRQVAVANA